MYPLSSNPSATTTTPTTGAGSSPNLTSKPIITAPAQQPVPTPSHPVDQGGFNMMNFLVPKSEARSMPQNMSVAPNPVQKPLKPIFTGDKVTEMRKTMADQAIADQLYHADPAFKAQVDRSIPFMKKQNADWQARFPTVAINTFYKLNNPLKTDKGTTALLQNIGNPPTTPSPFLTNPASPSPNTAFQDATQNVQNMSDAVGKYKSGEQGLLNTGAQVGANAVSGFLQPVTHVMNTVMAPFAQISNGLLDQAGNLGTYLAGTNTGQDIKQSVENSPTTKAVVQPLMSLVSAVQQHQNDPTMVSAKAIGQAAMDVMTAVSAYHGASAVRDATPAFIDNMKNTDYTQMIKDSPQVQAVGETLDSLKERVPALQQTPEQVAEGVKSLAGKITQGDKETVAKAQEALQTVDTRGVKNYDDLSKVLQNKLDGLKSAQDQILDKQAPESVSLDSFNKKISTKSGGTELNMNPVTTALDHLQELYAKTGDPENYIRIKNMIEDAQANGITAKGVNDIAREYGTEFGSKAFSRASGDPLTSVNAQMYENTRSAVKDAARSLLPNATSKLIDEQMSNAISTKRAVDDVGEKAAALRNRVETRNFVERAGRLVGKGINLVTFNGLKGFLQSFLDSNVGLKMKNYMSIEESLSKNLSKFQNLVKKLPDMSDSDAAAEINKFVTENHTGPQLQMATPQDQGAPRVQKKPIGESRITKNVIVPAVNNKSIPPTQ